MAEGFHTAVGIELENGRLTVVRRSGRAAPRVVLENSAADGPEALACLAELAGEVSRGRLALALAAPAARTVIRRLRAPFASRRKAAKVWPALLDVELPFPVESAVCIYTPTPPEGNRAAALAIAIRKSDLAAALEEAAAAGVDPTHLDAEGPALWDRHRRATPATRDEGATVLIHLAAGHVTLARGIGGILSATHVFRRPVSELEPGQWTERLRQVLAAHTAETGATAIDIWWTGPGATDTALLTSLQNAMPSDVSLRHATHDRPAAFLADALAERALAGHTLPLRQGEAAHPALVRVRFRRERAACAAVIAAAVLTLVLHVASGRQFRARNDFLQTRLQQTAERLTGGPVQTGLETYSVMQALPTRDAETRPIRFAMAPEGLEALWLQALTEWAAQDAVLTRFSISPTSMLAEGSVPAIRNLDMLTERLTAAGWTIQHDPSGTTPDGRLSFALKGVRP